MPNWCSNFIRITGDKDKIENIKRLIELSRNEDEYPGLFTTLVGIPEGMSPTDYQEKWWDANIEHWGTKWDINPHETSVGLYDEEITICQETAWSPPIPFCQKIAQMFDVEVYIQYEEPGVDFAGECNCFPDGTYDDKEYTYSEGLYKTNNEYFWEGHVPDQLCYINEELEENQNVVEKIKDYFHFCNEEDLKEIIKQNEEEYGEQE